MMRHRLSFVAASAALMLALVWAGAVPAQGVPAQEGTAQASIAMGADLGAIDFANSGAPEAQQSFQAGLAALHSFFFDEAADLFREARETDPGFAMAYWGEAMSHNHPLWREVDLDAARAVLAELGETPEARAARAGSERERAYLAAAEALFGEGEKLDRDRAYRAALADLHERWPDDEDAAAFHALAIQGAAETAAWKGGEDEKDVIPARMESAAILEELIDEHPDHPGILHYMIHAYDDPVHAPLGLRAARTYARVAPAANHALHMPSHIFLQLGLWDRVVASNTDAVAASEAWVERRGHERDSIDLHSLSWLHYAHLQLGDLEGARADLALAREVAEEAPSRRSKMTLASMESRQVVATGATEAPPLPALDDEESMPVPPLSAGVWAAYRRGDLEAASELSERLSGASTHDDSHYGDHGASALQAEALVLWMRGKRERALERLREAVAREDSAGPPSGPPFPFKPSHELLGEWLLEMDRPEEAARAFGRALARTKGRSEALDGAARAAAVLGETGRAESLRAQLPDGWSASRSQEEESR
jgi:tetratricopeptide (TPR) repeat protein